jgi:hypothetical protein
MYTRRKKLPKDLRQSSNGPTLLGSAVSAAVHGRTEDLLHLTIEYFHCDETKDMSELATLFLHLLGEIHRRAEPTDHENEIIQKASKELQKSHRQFRAAMTWLCSPKGADQIAPPSLRLVASGKWEPGRYPQIDKKTENIIRFFENHGIKHFKSRLSLQDGRLLPLPRIVHLVDLFCAYVLDRCLGRTVSKMPIKSCPTCRKLFVSDRKHFCSKECQWNHYWTPERRADDKWVKDLEKFSKHCKPKYGRSLADFQKKLALPKVKQRLASIKKKIEQKDWAGWEKIAQRIEEIESLATESR